MISKLSPLYPAVTKVITSWGDRNHINARKHLASELGFRGDNAHVQLTNILNFTTYNPVAPKHMNVDHLHIILTEVDDFAREKILSALVEPHGYTLQSVAPSKADAFGIVSVLKMVLHLDQKHGKLSEALSEAVEDEVIDAKEKQLLREIAGDFRAALRKLEHMLGEIKPTGDGKVEYRG